MPLKYRFIHKSRKSPSNHGLIFRLRSNENYCLIPNYGNGQKEQQLRVLGNSMDFNVKSEWNCASSVKFKLNDNIIVKGIIFIN